MKRIICFAIVCVMLLSCFSECIAANDVLRLVKGSNFETGNPLPDAVFTGGWALNGATRAVEDDGTGNKVIHLTAEKSSSSAPDAVYSYDFSKVINPIVKFRTKIIEDGDMFQCVLKETNLGAFAFLIKMSNGTMTALGYDLGSYDSGWYEFEIRLYEDKTADIYVNNELKRDGVSITNNSSWNLRKTDMRLQLTNNGSTGSTTEAYLDDFGIYVNDLPKITLNGESTVELTKGDSYVDPGATATDVIDGNITNSIVANSNLNTNVTGTYYIKYDVTTADGTTAETVTRTIIVKEKNLLEDAAVTASSQLEGFDAENMFDLSESTGWKSNEKSPSCLFTLSKECVIDNVNLIGTEGVDGIDVIYSNDNKFWNKAQSLISGQGTDISLSYEPFCAKYLKITFEGSGGITVNELKLASSDESVVDIQLEKIKDSMPDEDFAVSSSISLLQSSNYGCQILWSSSNTEVISNNGSLTVPEDDTAVTLNVAVMYGAEREEYSFGPYTVRGNKSSERKVVFDDFNTATNSSILETFSNVYTGGGAVVDVSGGMVSLQANNSGAGGPDAYLEYNISEIANPVLKFKLKAETLGNTARCVLKDQTNSKFGYPAEIKDGNLYILGTPECAADEDKWYDFVIRLYDDKTADVFLDGVQKCDRKSFTSETNWDFSNTVFRIQAQNGVASTNIEYVVDDFGVYINERPLITLNGDDTVTLIQGAEYEELGATALDTLDGDLTDSIVVTGDVDTTTLGTYKVLYNVTASDGTKAEPAVRYIVVTDGNLLSDASLSLSDNDALKLLDRDLNTVYSLGASESIIASFDREVIAETVTIKQVGTNIEELTLYKSSDGSSWEQITAAVTYDGSDISANFALAPFKYLKVVAAGGDVKIAELGCYVKRESVVGADKSLLSIVSQTSGSDIVLPKEGKYGSSITWKSNDTSAVLNNGTVMSVTKDRTVVMTATITYLGYKTDKQFNVVVLKNSSGAQGNTGILGGSGGSGGSGGNSIAVIPNVNTPVPEHSTFIDVQKDHWGFRYIEDLYELGAISGVDDMHFEPDRSVRREEFLKILLAAFKTELLKDKSNFADVDESEWYYDYVVTAKKLGIAVGLNDELFGIGSDITRQDAAVMIHRMMKNLNYSGSSAKTTFVDTNLIADYAVDSVELLYAEKIINGDDKGAFRPQDAITRAEAAKIIKCSVDKLCGSR